MQFNRTGKAIGYIPDTVATLEIANNVRIKVSRSYIAGLQKDLLKESPPDKEKKG